LDNFDGAVNAVVVAAVAAVDAYRLESDSIGAQSFGWFQLIDPKREAAAVA